MIENKQTSLLEFPCDFPIKAFGLNHESFSSLVIEIVQRHAPNLTEGAITDRTSKGGKYTSVTVTIRADCQEKLDAIYRDLSGHPEIIMVL
jgi:putative lipoic acid-binding regulatory protein